MEENEIEVWKDIIGFEKYYQISNLGRIKFLERQIPRFTKTQILKEKIVKVHLGKRGYYVADLVVKSVRKTLNIHRLVAIHFIDNPLNKKYVNHIDENKLNNSISNLEWVTNMENICHYKRLVKSSSQYIGVGWDKYSKKWKSQIYHKGKSIHLGNFNTEEEAYKSRIRYEKENNIINKYL